VVADGNNADILIYTPFGWLEIKTNSIQLQVVDMGTLNVWGLNFSSGGADLVNENGTGLHLGGTGQVNFDLPPIGDGSGLTNVLGISNVFVFLPSTNLLWMSGAPAGTSNGLYVWSGNAYTNGTSGVLQYSDGYWYTTNTDHQDVGGADVVAYTVNGFASTNWVDLSTGPINGMTTAYGTNLSPVISPYHYGDGGGLTNLNYAGDGSHLTNLNDPNLARFTNGAWLNGVCYGTNLPLAVSYATNANNEIWLDDCTYNLGVLAVNHPLNLKGSGSGAVNLTGRTITGGPILNGKLYLQLGWSNSVLQGFSLKHASTSDGLFIYAGGNWTNRLRSEIRDVKVLCTDTNGSGEGLYISGADLVLDHVFSYCETMHGFILKGVSNIVVRSCGVFDLPSATSPYDVLYISADSGAGAEDRQITIENFTVNNVHTVPIKFHADGTALISDVEINGCIISGQNYDPSYGNIVWMEVMSTNAVINNVRIHHIAAEGDWPHGWAYYCPVAAAYSISNVLCFDWSITDTNLAPSGLVWRVANWLHYGLNSFYNINLNGTNFSGVDDTINNGLAPDGTILAIYCSSNTWNLNTVTNGMAPWSFKSGVNSNGVALVDVWMSNSTPIIKQRMP
jgi:hypothetical protein